MCFINPHDNVPHKARILAQPCGGSRSPENWGRVGTPIQFLAMKLRTLTVGAFADDVYCAAPASNATCGFRDAKQLDGLMGFPKSEKKDHPTNTNIVLLGSQISLGSTSICANDRPGRINTLRGHIAQALQTNCVTPAAASKLRWGRGFYGSLLSGEPGS